MKIILDNIQSTAIIGGVDNLLPVNLNKVLKEYLSVKVDGAEFSAAYREHRWDGKKAFITADGRFASGFLQNVLKFCTEQGAKIELEDIRGPIPKLRQDLITNLGVWEMRDYQIEAVKSLDNYITLNEQKFYWPRGIIDAATNAGKNSIMAGISKNMENSQSIMIINRQEIFKQAVKFFEQIFDVGVVDSKNYRLGEFTIAMQQTLLNRAQKSLNVRNDLTKFNVLFADECHYAGGSEYAQLLSLIPAPVRTLVSGTSLDSDKDVNKMIIVGSAGKFLYQIRNKELIEKKVSQRPIINVLYNKCGFDRPTYDQNVEKYIFESKERVDELKKWIIDNGHLNKQIIVAFNTIKHGEFMFKEFALDARFAEALNIDWTHGKDPERTEKIESFKNGEINILFASTIIQEGLNIPNMEVLVYAIEGESKIQLKQFIGRAVRDDGVNTEVQIVLFYDACRWLDKHSRTRLKICRGEEFEIKFHYNADKLGRLKAA